MTTGIDDSLKDMAQVVGNPTIYNMPAPASFAGSQVYTAAQLLGGIIVHDGTGGVNGTLPTAALLVAAMSALGHTCRVGDTIFCLIVNGANASGSVTLVAGTGGGFDANQGGGSRIIAFGSSKTVQIRVTNAAVGSEAYVIYS